VVLDPPEKGVSPLFLRNLLRYNPALILYVSCNPTTQLRDLAQLESLSRRAVPLPSFAEVPLEGSGRVCLEGRVIDVDGGKVVGERELADREGERKVGYSIVNVTLFDMFPQTVRVESVVTLVRNDLLPKESLSSE
jgi:hypothetical protein